MLYTIIPEEMVLQGLEDVRACQEICHKGRTLMIQPLGFREMQVVQLVSTDPADYLDPELQPGSIIKM